ILDDLRRGAGIIRVTDEASFNRTSLGSVRVHPGMGHRSESVVERFGHLLAIDGHQEGTPELEVRRDGRIRFDELGINRQYVSQCPAKLNFDFLRDRAELQDVLDVEPPAYLDLQRSRQKRALDGLPVRGKPNLDLIE